MKRKSKKIDLFALSRKEIEKIKAPELKFGGTVCECENSGGGLAKQSNPKEDFWGYNFPF